MSENSEDYYLLSGDPECEKSVTFGFSPEKEEILPFPKGVWSPYTDLSFSDDGVFTEKSATELSKLWLLIRPLRKELPQVMNYFSISYDTFPAFSNELVEAIDSLDPSLCQFVPTGPIQDTRGNRQFPANSYHFVMPRNIQDCWDIDKSGIKRVDRKRGDEFFYINPPYMLDKTKLKGVDLWRDSLTNNVICSDRFKKIAQTTGCSGLGFKRVTVA